MELKVLIRGGGDLATGVAYRLFKSGMKIIITELKNPLVIRRTVAFASAVYNRTITVENVTAKLTDKLDRFEDYIPIFIDPECRILNEFKPHVLIDAIMAKRNTGTNIDMAPLVIALGPGFEAGVDVHRVIETQRGHNLGKIIEKGFAEPDTGIPGEVGGASEKRIIRAPADGIFNSILDIGDIVKEGDVLGKAGKIEVKSGLSGIIRGLIKDGTPVKEKLKIGDVDPRARREYIYTISDKARALSGSVLEAIMNEFRENICFNFRK